MSIINKIKAYSLVLGFTLLGGGLVTSCSKEDDKVFSQPASTRVDEAILALRKQLSSAEHGWIMEYYPNKFRAYGGYVLGLKFDTEGNVSIASQHLQKPSQALVSARSLYRIDKDRSLTLNFVTHNEHIHYYADPGVGIGAGYGKGLEGDFEFLVMESDTPDLIVLKGKKTQNIIKMYKAKEPLKDYLAKVVADSEAMYTVQGLNHEHMEALSGTIAGKKVDLLPSDDGYAYYTIKFVEETNHKLHGKKLPYSVAPQGLHFYEPVEGISSLAWNASDKSFTTEKGDKLTARLDPVYPEYAKFLGNYTFQFTSGGATKTYDVSFTEGSRNEYLITGSQVPFTIRANYDAEHKRFEIRSQKVYNGEAMLAVWAAPDGTNLAWGDRLGMYSRLASGSTNTYEMVDNGAWGSFVAKSYVVWKPGSGVFSKQGFSAYIVSPKFIRKN